MTARYVKQKGRSVVNVTVIMPSTRAGRLSCQLCVHSKSSVRYILTVKLSARKTQSVFKYNFN